MHAHSLKFRGTSGITVLALALLLASCVNRSYTIGGTVSSLTGTGLVLQNNGGDNLAMSANGAFTFSKEVKKDARYNVTVFGQASGQACTVTNGSGTVKSDVTNVAVACVANAPSTFTVGGTVSGLTGTGLVLQNNGGKDLPIAADGLFTFAAPLANAATYNVTVFTQPAGQGCVVANGNGTISGANVGNVAVTCAAAPGGPAVNLSFGLKDLQFSWGAVAGSTFYRLLENPDGVSGYTLVADNIAATSYNYTIPVHKRMNASYIVEACNAGGCNGSQPQSVSSQLLTQAIGYAKASNIVAKSTGTGDQFGQSAAVSGDGNTLAVGAPNEASGLTGVRAGSVDEATAGNAASFAGAVYVFARISGVWAQQAYVKASNTAAFAFFGGAVALSGDGNTLVVGASGAESAYIFTRTSGAWSQQALVTASNAEVGDMFGAALALSGDGNTLAVGAFSEASEVAGVIPGAPTESATPNAASGGNGAGAVYVYTRSGAAWSQQAYVKASNPEASDNLGTPGDLFGSAIALSSNGNTLAVGAPFESSAITGVRSGAVSEVTAGNGSSMSGAAYVYLRSGTTWTQQAYVKASNTGDFDTFGNAVALSGDGNTLAVGAPGEASSGTGVGSTPDELAGGSGAAYVYSRGGSTWSQQAFVQASNTGSNDSFGNALALSGDGNTLAVGAPMEDGSGLGAVGTAGAVYDDLAADAGAAYVYTRSGGTWSTQTFVKASNTGSGDQFGWALTLSDDGNTLAVGARMEDGVVTGIGTAPGDGIVTSKDAGAVYLY